MELLCVNSRSDMMVLRIECAKLGKEAPKECKEVWGAPIFLIPNYVLDNLLEEGFTIKWISTILAVSESTIYCRMSQYGLSYSLLIFQTKSSMWKLKK